MAPSTLYTMWMDIQDIVGRVKLWPKRVRTAFWAQDPDYFQKFLMVTFAWVNGLSMETLLEWLIFRRKCFPGDRRHKHIVGLFRDIGNGRGQHYFGFNVTMNRYEYMDRVKHYTPK